MSALYTADEIITLARSIAAVPNSGALGSTDADMLRLLNEWLGTVLVPAIAAAKEDYYSVPVRTPCVSTTDRYRIHPRAMFSKVRTVRYVNADGEFVRTLTLLPSADLEEYGITGKETADAPEYAWLEGPFLRISPKASKGWIEQLISFRPGRLVLRADARQVQSVAGASVTLTAPVPSGWIQGSIFDLHSEFSGAEIKAFDRKSTSVIGSTIEFSAPLDGTLTGELPVEAGDWVTLCGFSAVPPAPYEFQPLLAQALAAKFAETSDLEAFQFHKASLDEAFRLALSQLKPRVEGKPTKIRGRGLIAAQGRGFF